MEKKMIFEKMAAAMADIGAVGKSQTNQQQHFRYRGIDDAMNALYPILSKHGLFLVPEVMEQHREERVTKNGGNLIYSILKVRYTMYASDGSSVSAVVIGEGMDSADKSSNKAIAAAMKYAIFQMFCIPTEDMRNDDPDKETPPDSTPEKQQPANAARNAGASAAKMTTSARIGIDRKALLNATMEKLGCNVEQFGVMRQTLIDGGAVVNKPTKELTDDEYKQLLNAVIANFAA